MQDVHDYHLVGYEVDGDAKRIVLRAEYRYPNIPMEKTNVVFEGVAAYSFRYDCLGNIIFAIEEKLLENAVREHWSEFDAGYRHSGWPPFWELDKSKAEQRIARLAENGVKWFELSSSYGMGGWVICRTVEYRVLAPGSGPSDAT